MPSPMHCLYLLLERLCSQMLAPPHCLHPLLRRLSFAVVLADARPAALPATGLPWRASAALPWRQTTPLPRLVPGLSLTSSSTGKAGSIWVSVCVCVLDLLGSNERNGRQERPRSEREAGDRKDGDSGRQEEKEGRGSRSWGRSVRRTMSGEGWRIIT
jgi:hypothetical protein